ncbi:DUF6896 domain-containing protein [Streptomyces sp. NPDC058622]|uniref:DUF6896 domain-containing protein n=1 Tax=Streptomyces sp. NPDC058622 TaxID=3346562 RepID=UPI00365466EF
MRDTVQPPGQAVPARTTSSLTTPVKTSVLYQPVPGLTEVQGGTGLATDFADLHADAREVDRLRSPGSRRISRSGQVGTYSYTVHGARTSSSATTARRSIFDFAADRSEIFDLWRLCWYGLSLPEPLDVRDQGF